MARIAKKTDQPLWDKVRTEVTEGDKGGRPGQWSARKAQLATHEYKAEGGGYDGAKSADNHLAQWTGEEWGTKSGAKSGQSGERYLPKAARETLSGSEYGRTTNKKREDTAKGKQFSAQPADVAAKTAKHRKPAHGLSLAALRKRASSMSIPGRSKMKKVELERALADHG